jgi:excisionase family DNA binding protein
MQWQRSHATVFLMQDQTTRVQREFMRSREVMELADISRRTLDRWTSNGTLPVIRPAGSQRRYRRTDVERLLSGGEPP